MQSAAPLILRVVQYLVLGTRRTIEARIVQSSQPNEKAGFNEGSFETSRDVTAINDTENSAQLIVAIFVLR